ncbi:MAG TPA: hypothetical protein VLT56_06395 [Desulfobacterales bacterium]|nr:hypothetical protein [Desulfobacterales bacterium]
MKTSSWRRRYLAVAVIAMWVWLYAAPAGAQPGPGGVHVLPPAKAAWNELLQRSPFPYLMPLPEHRPTAVDGTYTKFVVAQAERVHCLRCPDYAPEGGLWKIRFDKGTFRIIHTETAWKSIGTFIVAGDRLLLANDPNCIDTVGLYTWRLEEGQFFLEVVDDPCAIKLRGLNLTQQPWRACRPPTIEAAVTEHWPKPEGCD